MEEQQRKARKEADEKRAEQVATTQSDNHLQPDP